MSEGIEEFMGALHSNIHYWEKQNVTIKEQMEGVTFSILCMLDGVSGSYDGNIYTLSRQAEQYMLHELFYEKNTCREI